VKGWKISPSHYITPHLSTIWLDKLGRTPRGPPKGGRRRQPGIEPRPCIDTS
jgi:hypothetical protein